MSSFNWLGLSSILLAGLIGCKQQTVVMSDDELDKFNRKPEQGGIVGSQSETRPSEGGNPGVGSPEGSGLGTAPPDQGTRTPGLGGQGMTSPNNPEVEANASRPNNPDGNRPNRSRPENGGGDMGGFRRPRGEAERTETGDFTVAGAKVSVIGVFRLKDGKVSAWNADGSPNSALKTEMDSALSKIPEGVRGMMTNMGEGNMIFVLSRVDGAKRQGMISGEFGGGRMFGGLAGNSADNRILSVANVEDGSSTVSVRYRVEETAPMTSSIPFKEGGVAKMGNGTITLQAINAGAAAESEAPGRPEGRGREGMTPTAHLVFLKASLSDAPFSLQLIGKDGKPFTLVDKDGKPTAMPAMPQNGNNGRTPNMGAFRDIRPAYMMVDNDATSVVVNLMVKRDLISSIKVTVAPQTIIERKGIAAKPK